MLSILSLISVGFATGLVIYQITSKPRTGLSNYQSDKHSLSLHAAAMIILPFVIASAIAYEGYINWQSITKAIFVWSMTLSFWYSLLFIPLAIRSSYKESHASPSSYYPSVSILVPAYNEEKVIAQTIEALVNSDYPQKEIIVVDDGSEDKTLEIAQRYKSEIKVLHKENGGKASALNYGLVFAKGEIIVVVDADTIIGINSLKMIVSGFYNKEVVAIAGNIKIKKTMNWLTRCQALEYMTTIQLMRRGLDNFGTIAMVPGALGAFRRAVLREVGEYSKDTLVEDFDTTVKVLKSGLIVQGSNEAVAYTQAPQTLRDFYRQRKRWYRGNLQNMIKHKDILTTPRFGFLHKITWPLMVINMLVIPFTGFLILAFAIANVITGQWTFVLYFAVLYAILQHLLVALAIRIEGDGKNILPYSIFALIGYKQLVDFLSMKAVIEEALKRKASWTSAERIK